MSGKMRMRVPAAKAGASVSETLRSASRMCGYDGGAAQVSVRVLHGDWSSVFARQLPCPEMSSTDGVVSVLRATGSAERTFHRSCVLASASAPFRNTLFLQKVHAA